MDGDGPALHPCTARAQKSISLSTRLFRPITEQEIVFDTFVEERLFVVAGMQDRRTRRRKIVLGDCR